MDTIILWLKEQIAANSFFQGGFVLMIISGVVFFCRSLPGRIYRFVWWLCTCTISFDDRTPFFDFFQEWLSKESKMGKKRSIFIKIDEKSDPPKVMALPDRLTYWISIDGMLCQLTRARDKEGSGVKGAESPASEGGARFLLPERYWLVCAIWNKGKIVQKLTQIMEEYSVSDSEYTPVYTCRWGYWNSKNKQPKRAIENLVFKKGLLQSVVDDMSTFRNSRKWYDERQVPYQRGYIFYGPPGTGKTSLAAALASYFKMRLCILDLGCISTDTEIKDAFISAPGRAIILIEDFDSFFDGRDVCVPDSKLTFSGFLNAINGVLSNPGRVLIMTTNKVSDVDPALLRCGRIDRTFFLDYVDSDQASRIAGGFFSGAAIRIGTEMISPADLIGHLQKYKDNRDKALDVQLLYSEFQDKSRLDTNSANKSIIYGLSYSISKIVNKMEACTDLVSAVKDIDDFDDISSSEVVVNWVQGNMKEYGLPHIMEALCFLHESNMPASKRITKYLLSSPKDTREPAAGEPAVVHCNKALK